MRVYTILSTAIAVWLIHFSASAMETFGPAPLWIGLLVCAGAVLGHLLTEALNSAD